MVVSASGRFAGLVQIAAMLAAALAVFGIARRVGLNVPAALFSALLFCTLPAVALQASSGMNDVIVASLVAGSAFILLTATRSSLLLAALAVALLVGAKLTGLIALPALAAIAVAAPRSRRLGALSMVALGAAVG